jgi:hypothetical protein
MMFRMARMGNYLPSGTWLLIQAAAATIRSHFSTEHIAIQAALVLRFASYRCYRIVGRGCLGRIQHIVSALQLRAVRS